MTNWDFNDDGLDMGSNSDMPDDWDRGDSEERNFNDSIALM